MSASRTKDMSSAELVDLEATPTLIVTYPLPAAGWTMSSFRTSRRMASATVTASSSATFGSTTANSSPPFRAAKPPVSNVMLPITLAMRRRQPSPAWWPSVSLKPLKWSINQQDRKRAVDVVGLTKEGIESAAIRQSSQAIRGCQLREPLIGRGQIILEPFLLRDVAQDADDLEGTAFPGLRQLEVGLEPNQLAILAPGPEANRARAADILQIGDGSGQRIAIDFKDQIGEEASDQRRFGDTEHDFDGMRHVAHASLDVRHDHDISNIFRQQTVAFLALLKRPFKARPIAELSCQDNGHEADSHEQDRRNEAVALEVVAPVAQNVRFRARDGDDRAVLRTLLIADILRHAIEWR